MKLNKSLLNSAVTTVVVALVCSFPMTVFAQSKPNVIVIIADDAGYADFGFMNGLSGENSVVPTPSLDALANRGVTFSRAYVGQSCQPTRAALVTGGYQNRIGNEVVGNNIEGLPSSATTIFDRMQSVGYTTGVVGKWHLGSVDGPQGNRPETQGVDEFYGIYHGSRSYFGGAASSQTQVLRETIVDPNTGNFTNTVVEAAHSGEYVTNTFGQYGKDFITDHHADADPFFLYQSFTAPHTPLQNSPDFNDSRLDGLSGDQKVYASMMLTMDTQIGELLGRLDDPNNDGNTSDSIADNTMIVFINDNGGADAASSSPNGADNGNLRRGKGSPYEGGIRVPMIIAGAGVSASAEGSVYDKPVHGFDILPTAFAAGGGTLGPGDTGIDGVDLLPHVNGVDASNPHDAIVNRHRGQVGVVKGDWKLVKAGNGVNAPYALFNLANDPSEAANIAGANPTIVAELQRDLTDKEAVFDKQRYAILGRTAEETINLFDHFAFRPGVQTNWSADDAWLEGGASTVETMFASDAFAGAVLEFGTSNSDYTSNNDMVRGTGLEFMLNKVALTGDFNGATDRTATIQGNELLFTKDLSGVGPQITIDATQSGSGNFAYNIDNDLVMYDDLEITGDGDVDVTINGQIREYHDPRGLTKSGASKVTLTGENTYTGTTTIAGGTLALSGVGSLDNTESIEVQAGATFDVSGRTTGELSIITGQLLHGSGTVAGDILAVAGSEIGAGSTDFGQLLITGDLTLEAGSTLSIDLGQGSLAGTDYDQLMVLGNFDILGGDLTVSHDDWASIGANEIFNILNAGSYGVGSFFASINLPELSNGLTWDTSSLLTSGQISTVAAIPEPGSLLFLGGVSVLAIRRRRRA